MYSLCFIVIAFACLTSAAHWQSYTRLHSHGSTKMVVLSLALISQASGGSSAVILPRDVQDEQDDCDAEEESSSSGEGSNEGGDSGTNTSASVTPTSSSSSGASASASQSSSALPNSGGTADQKDATNSGEYNQNGQSQGQSMSASSTAPAPASTTTSSSTPPNPASGASVGGEKAAEQVVDSGNSATSGSFTASFTEYGSGDDDGSGNCNTASAACGFYNNPGYNAAISQAVFGAGPGQGAGPACGNCYKLMPEGGSAQSIVVKVNNLCPDDGNPLCSMPQGVDVNFDLCRNDGAAAGLFGGAGPFQVNGTAVQVDCGEWSGSADLHI